MTIPPLMLDDGSRNLLLNPSAEPGLTGIETQGAGTTRTRDTSKASHGQASVRVVTNGTVVNQGIRFLTASGLGTTTARTFSGFVDVTGSGSLQVFLRAYYTDTTSTIGSITTHDATGNFVTITPATITTTAGKTLDFVTIFVRTAGTLATTFWTDRGQIVEGATPGSFSYRRRAPGFLVIGSDHIGPMRVGRR